jgi:hypothetical protein
MLPQLPDDSLLLIRCPSCGQRFKVGEDLRERTVECGGCEHRFRIDDLVIVRGRKFYPGERRDPVLSRFSRVSLASGVGEMPLGTVAYANLPDPSVLEPASPQRLIAGAIGAAGIVLMALLLMFGASRGGILDGMSTENRLVMAGFASLMGIIGLVYANPRARLKALGISVFMSSCLLTVPFFFTSGSIPLEERPLVQKPLPGLADPEEVPVEEEIENEELSALRREIGTAPLDDEIKRLAAEGSQRQASGLWLRGLSESNRYLVKDYILRVTGADPSTHYYPRGAGDFLLVVTGITKAPRELAIHAAELGEVVGIYEEVSVIEVRVNNENFVEGPIEKLKNKQDPEFYELNKRELKSIDLLRVKRAVQRLAEAEPKLYRSDITRELVALMGQNGIDFKGNLAVAVGVWSEEPGLAAAVTLAELEKMVASNEAVPREMIALLVKETNHEVIPVLDELWFKTPMVWETLYGEMGPAAEAAIIRRFPQARGTVRYSAVRLLGKVGGADSLPVLESARTGLDAELKILVEKALESIRARSGE